MIEIIGHALSQWDVGRSVQITGIEADHAHFANKGDSKAVIMGVVDTKAKIPDYLLQTGKQLCVYAVKDGITVESKTFYVQKRERPENYVYEDDQRNYIYELITSAETAVEDANNAADSANEAADKANAATKAFADIGKNFVKTINGVAPDENGNVNVEGGGGGSGEPGADGFSPVATVTQTGSGAVISITDKSGTTTAAVFNGKDGKDGYTPVKDVDYFDGAPGKDGVDGKDGAQGIQGEQGPKGDTGAPGANGKDGVSATHSWNGTTLTITSASGTSSANLKGDKGDKGDQGIQGEKGETGAAGSNGTNGKDGENGTSVTVKSVSESTADGGNNVVTFSDGKTVTIKNGSKGSAGYNPVRGVDYWTADDIAAIKADIATELAKRGQLEPLYAKSIAECTDTTKLYVLPDGFIYAYLLTEKEVTTGPSYNNLLDDAINSDKTPYVVTNSDGTTTVGYKKGWRLNSSGVEKESDSNCMTGFIPVKNGQTIRVKNVTISSGSNGYFHWYKSDFSLGGSAYYENYNGSGYSTKPDANGVITFNAPPSSTHGSLTYFRMTTGVISDATIITVNEEITEGGSTEIVEEWAWTSTGHAFVPADYEDRIIDLETQSAKNTADIEALKKGATNVTAIAEWDAPIYDANIPVFQLSMEKAAKTNATMTPTALYAMYDALMAKYPHYITKTDLGICSDGVNRVYRYDFKDPEQRCFHNRKSETKAKAIIVSGIHLEWAGMFGLYYALEEITENPVLRDLRRNVHLIVIPCCNPYVTLSEYYEQHGGQQNANGVEVHRNFEVDFLYPDDAGYVPFGELHHGGTEPLSEVETQYIDNVLKENTDAALFMTCHNFNLDSYYGISFIWPSVATKYMCNMGYRLIDKLSDAWMDKYGDELAPGIASYRTEDLESWDTRLGYGQISGSPGTETKQATKYGIQAANIEICERFHVHGTKENPEPLLSSFTMSRGAEVYVNFLLTAFGVYDPKDKALYG